MQRLMSRRQLAAYLAVSPTTVDRMTKRGDLPEPIRFGGVVRWDVKKIDALINSMSPSAADEYDDPDVVMQNLRQQRAKNSSPNS
jgi:predicted DNA-binding transcriptional regulator AlpA